MNLEEALRERYSQVCRNIQADYDTAELFAKATGLQNGYHKRQHSRMLERVQVEWYKHDELKVLAIMAGIDLKGGEDADSRQELQTTSESFAEANAEANAEAKGE